VASIVASLIDTGGRAWMVMRDIEDLGEIRVAEKNKKCTAVLLDIFIGHDEVHLVIPPAAMAEMWRTCWHGKRHESGRIWDKLGREKY
jgi:hypothetical protein